MYNKDVCKCYNKIILKEVKILPHRNNFKKVEVGKVVDSEKLCWVLTTFVPGSEFLLIEDNNENVKQMYA